MNNPKILIERLEHLSNKKVFLCEDENGDESSIFKPLKINERLGNKRKELVDKGIIVVDEKSKTLTFKNNMNYIEYMILCTFYKNYIIDVEGNVNLFNCNLSSIDIQFNNVGGYFNCNFNNLKSLKGCPKIVNGWFGCGYNNLTSLKYCPKTVRKIFDCSHNSKKITKEEVKKVCDVKGKIYC